VERGGEEGKQRRVVVVVEERWAVRPCERGYKTEFGFSFYLFFYMIFLLSWRNGYWYFVFSYGSILVLLRFFG
jgi:hypothetical protein